MVRVVSRMEHDLLSEVLTEWQSAGKLRSEKEQPTKTITSSDKYRILSILNICVRNTSSIPTLDSD